MDKDKDKAGRSPHGERGLKSGHVQHPTHGRAHVAPLTGSVD